MKAIVMAGGEGTRLRPVTGGRPKPMVELMGKPLLQYTVELLKKYGFTDLCFTLRYLPRSIEDYFGSGETFGVHITTRVETEPLGTAGGVRACRDFVGGEDFLVISGDAVCDFNLRECMQLHRKRGADAAIVVTEHPEPTAYGLVLMEEDGRITRFAEKPAWERVNTGLVNTGIYILSPCVFDLIPAGRACDFGNELFPRMLREKRSLYGVRADGYWCDIGTPSAYRRCCSDVLAGRVKISTGATERRPGIWSIGQLPEGARLIPPVYIGRGARVEAGARVGPGCVISDGTAVLAGATISDAVINGALIKKNANLSGCIIGRGASVGEGVRISQGCVVGDGAVVGDGCVLAPDVKLDCRRQVEAGSAVRWSLMGEGRGLRPLFHADGKLCGDYLTELSPEHALALGGAMGTLGRVAVAGTGSDAARLLLTALGCGVTGAGGSLFELDARFEAELQCCLREYDFPGGVFVRQRDGAVSLSFFERGGIPAGTGLTRKLEAALGGEYPRATGPAVGGASRVVGTERICQARYVEEAERLGGVAQTVAVPGGGPENRSLRDTLGELGCDVLRRKQPGVPSMTVTTGGAGLTAVDEEGRSLDSRHMAVVAASALFRCGETSVAAEFSAPFVLEDVASAFGGRILRRFRDGQEAETLAREHPTLRNGIMAAIAVLAAMRRDGITLSQMSSSTPSFHEAGRSVEVSCSRARAMELLVGCCDKKATELSWGVTVDTGVGRARISPSRLARALEIHGECPTEEQAEELCGHFEQIVRRLDAKEMQKAVDKL